MYYHDNRSGKDQIITEVFGKIYLVRTGTGIIIGIEDGLEDSELQYYALCKDESGFKLIETDKPDSTGLTSVSSSHRVMLDDGRSVVFSKNNGEANYSYSIDGISGVIKDLTSKDALRSGVYNDFLVEGDKVIGALEFTEWRHGGIGPKNMLETRDLKGSALFEFDINTYESKILYEIEGNKTQIIGYKEGQIYLYRKGKIIKRSLDGYGEKVICSVRKNKHQLSFNWLNDTLVIFDKDDCKVVGSCNG